MKLRLLDVLCCPSCGDQLKSHSFEERENKIDNLELRIKSPICKSYCGLKNIILKENNDSHEKYNFNCITCYKKEIVDGVLTCVCGNLFPIINSVPRLLDGTLETFPDFATKYKDKLASLTNGYEKQKRFFALIDKFKSIHDSFSEEWSFFEYDQDKTWGWSTKDRKAVFLNEIGYAPSQLKDKLLLDAGCGNGILTTILSDFDMEVFGLDISESVVRAEANKTKFSRNNINFVHFVQGNLFTPPFKRATFDILYSSGVLHHCPDTKQTFLKLTPLVKENGRSYIWVYGKRGLLVRAFALHGRFLRKYISLKALFAYCKLLSLPYKVITDLLTLLNIYEFRKRTVREITLDLFDAFSPMFNHTHTPAELNQWFTEQSFSNLIIAGISKHGLGIRGDKSK